MIDRHALQAELTASGISVAELGRRLGYRGAPSYLLKIVNGDVANPSLEVVIKIAGAMEIPPYRILANELKELVYGELRDRLLTEGPGPVLTIISNQGRNASEIQEERRSLVLSQRTYPIVGRLENDGTGLPAFEPQTFEQITERVEFVSLPDPDAYVVLFDESPTLPLLGEGNRYVLFSPRKAVRRGQTVLARENNGKAWIRRYHANESGSQVVLTTAGEGEPIVIRRQDIAYLHAFVISKPVVESQKT